MIDHNDLMQEMEYIDTLSRNDRVKLASKRRHDQLATHSQWMKTDDFISTSKPRPKNRKGLKFSLDIELMDISTRNALDEMLELLNNGGDPNQKNHDGLTALHQCCIDGSLEMVTLLIKNGANVNVRDRDLWTPLHAAATCGHFKIVTILIKAGADLTALNGDGDMPHDIAEDEVMQQYLENELAKIGINEDTIEEVRQATRTTMLADVNDILSNSEDLNQPLDQGGTLLHVAIANGFNDMVSLLLKNGASISVRDEDGWEPIHVAAYWSNEKAVDMLAQSKHIDLRTTTDNGETPYNLCDDPELKIYILHLISDMSNKYHSVKNYDSPIPSRPIKVEESIRESDEVSNHSDDYEHTVGDSLVFNIPNNMLSNTEETENHKERPALKNDESDSSSDEDKQMGQKNQDEDAGTSNPLINMQASEFSERRNSVKEAKHLAPIKRANSLDRQYQPHAISIIHEQYDNNTTNGGNENDPVLTETTDKLIDSITSLATSSKPNTNRENENPPPYTPRTTTSPAPQSTSMTYATGDTTTIRNGTVPNIPASATLADSDTDTDGLMQPAPHRRHSKQRAPLPNVPQRQQHSEPLPNVSQRQQNLEPLPNVPQRRQHSERSEMNNNRGPMRPVSSNKSSLADLKRQRREARELPVESSHEVGQIYSNSTFYDTSVSYEPPPSPTMIRYHFKMAADVVKRGTSNDFIKEKKCVIM